MSHSEQLYAILKGKWLPDDDALHALMLNGPNDEGKRLFSWLRTDHSRPGTYKDLRPQPSMGTWCVVDTKLVLGDPNERIEYTVAVEHSSKITLTRTDDGTFLRFTRSKSTPKERQPPRRGYDRSQTGLSPYEQWKQQRERLNQEKAAAAPRAAPLETVAE